MGIFITSIKQPESGAVVAYHCPICGRTEIMLNLWGAKPINGDYWRVTGICIDFPPHSFMVEIKEPCQALGNATGKKHIALF